MSQRVKRQLNKSVEDGTVPTKRRKCRPRSPVEEEEARGSAASEAKGTPERSSSVIGCPSSGGGGNNGGGGNGKGGGNGDGNGGGDGSVWTPRPLNDLKSIYNRSATEAPAELFRKDLISAMKLPDSEPLTADEYWVITDQWKQEWERGVQVPVNPDSLPEPLVTVTGQHGSGVDGRHPDFRLPKGKYIRITKDDMFNPDDHILSSMPTRADKACAYDLDDCDIEWLRIVNGERALMGLSSISEDALERAIEEMEVRCWEKIQTIVRTEEGLGIEYDENVICDVCRSPDSEEGNEMVFCDLCNICVHQACYGITRIPPGSWLCRTCAVKLPRPECVLCPNRGGAMKCTRSGHQWAHVSCALWIPEVSIGCVERMEPITKISSIPQSRWALICVLCRERVGACIQCSVKTCKTAYHVTCAFKYGLEMKAIIEDESADDGVKLKSYCQKHSVTSKKERTGTGAGASSEDENSSRKRRKDMTSEEKNQAHAAKLQEIEAEFYKHVSTKDVSAHLAQQLNLDSDAITYIYNYWKLKRKAASNKPLLAPRTEEGDILSRKQEQADMEKRRMFVQLRQDLERVRNLCYMVSRREKLSRTFFRMREQTFHKQVAVLSHDGTSLTIAETEAILAANHGPSLYDQLYSHGSVLNGPTTEVEFEAALIRIAGRKRESKDGREDATGMLSLMAAGEKRKRKDTSTRQGPNGLVLAPSVKPPRTSTSLSSTGPASPAMSENPYKRTYFNGASSRRRNSLYSMSSGSEAERMALVKGRKDTSAGESSMTEDEKEVTQKKSVPPPKKVSYVNRTKLKSSAAAAVASSEEEEMVGAAVNKRRVRKVPGRSRTLMQMEKEMSDDRTASDSDDLIPPGTVSSKPGRNAVKAGLPATPSDKAVTKVKAAIYSDSDSEVPEPRKPSPRKPSPAPSLSSVASSSAESSSESSASSSSESSASSAAGSSSSGASKSGVPVRTKAFLKEFTGSGDKTVKSKSEVEPEEKSTDTSGKLPSKKKNVALPKKKKKKEVLSKNDFGKGKLGVQGNKKGKDTSTPPTDLIVPQRQAAKKATESMRFGHGRSVKDSNASEEAASASEVVTPIGNKKGGAQIAELTSSGKKSLNNETVLKKLESGTDIAKRIGNVNSSADASRKSSNQTDRKSSHRGKPLPSSKIKDVYEFDKDSNDENVEMDVDMNTKSWKSNTSKVKTHGKSSLSSVAGKDVSSKGPKDIYDFEKEGDEENVDVKEPVSKPAKSKIGRVTTQLSQKGKTSSKDIFDFTDDVDDVKASRKSHRPKVLSNSSKTKDTVTVANKDSSSKDSFESEKEGDPHEILAYVPQRQAAKKAAENIKGGLITKPTSTSAAEGEPEKESAVAVPPLVESSKPTKNKSIKARNKQKSSTQIKKEGEFNLSSGESENEYEDDVEDEGTDTKRKRKVRKEVKKGTEYGSEDVKENMERRRSVRKVVEGENSGVTVKTEEECGRKGNWPFLDKGTRSDLAETSKKKAPTAPDKKVTDSKGKDCREEKSRSDKRNVDDLFGKESESRPKFSESRPKFKGGTPDKKLKTSDRRPELGFRPPSNSDADRSGPRGEFSPEDDESASVQKNRKGPRDRVGDADIRPGDTPLSSRGGGGGSAPREPTKSRPTRATERRRRSDSTHDGKPSIASPTGKGKSEAGSVESKEVGVKKVLPMPSEGGEQQPGEAISNTKDAPSGSNLLHSSSGSSSSSSCSSSSSSSSTSSSSESSSESSAESSPEAPKEPGRRVGARGKTPEASTQNTPAADAVVVKPPKKEVEEPREDAVKSEVPVDSQTPTEEEKPPTPAVSKEDTDDVSIIEEAQTKSEKAVTRRGQRMSMERLAEKLGEDQVFKNQVDGGNNLPSPNKTRVSNRRHQTTASVEAAVPVKAPIISPRKGRSAGRIPAAKITSPEPVHEPVENLVEHKVEDIHENDHPKLPDIADVNAALETDTPRSLSEDRTLVEEDIKEITPSSLDDKEVIDVHIGASQGVDDSVKVKSDNKDTEETLAIVSEIITINDIDSKGVLVSDDDVKLIGEVKHLEDSSDLEEVKVLIQSNKPGDNQITLPSYSESVKDDSGNVAMMKEVAELAQDITAAAEKQIQQSGSNLHSNQQICMEPTQGAMVPSPLPPVPQPPVMFETEEEMARRLQQTFMHPIHNFHQFHNQSDALNRTGNAMANASHIVSPCPPPSNAPTPTLPHHQTHRSGGGNFGNQPPLQSSTSIFSPPHRDDLLFDDFENDVLAVDETATSEGGFGQHRHHRLSMQPRRSTEEGGTPNATPTTGELGGHVQSQHATPLPPPSLSSLQFSFPPMPDFFFREVTKEESARETLNLVEKLRLEYAKKTTTGPSSSAGAGTDGEDGDEDGPSENGAEGVMEPEFVPGNEELPPPVQMMPNAVPPITQIPSNPVIPVPVAQAPAISPIPAGTTTTPALPIAEMPIPSSPHPLTINTNTTPSVASSILLSPVPSTASLPHPLTPPGIMQSTVASGQSTVTLTSSALSPSAYPMNSIQAPPLASNPLTTSFTSPTLTVSSHASPPIQTFTPTTNPISSSPSSCAIIPQPVNQASIVQVSGIRSSASLDSDCQNISLHVGVIAASENYDALSDLGSVSLGVEKAECPNNSGVDLEPETEKVGYEACVLMDSVPMPGTEKIHGNEAEHSDERWVPPGDGCTPLPHSVPSSDTNHSNSTLAPLAPTPLSSDCIFTRVAQAAKWADSEVLPVRRSSSSSCASSSSTASSSNSSAGDNGRLDDDEEDRPIPPHSELLDQSIPTSHSHLPQHHHDQMLQQQHHNNFQTRIQTMPDRIRELPILPGDVNSVVSGASDGQLYSGGSMGGNHPSHPMSPPQYDHRTATTCDQTFTQNNVSSIFSPMDVNVPTSVATSESFLLPPPFSLRYSSSLQTKGEEPTPTPCGAAFTSSSHNMALTTAMVSPSPSPQPTLPPPPPPPPPPPLPTPPVQSTVSQQSFAQLSSPQPPQSPAFSPIILELLPPATPKTFNHSGRTPRRSPAKGTRASPRSKAQVIPAQVPTVSPPPKPSGRGRRGGRGGRGGRRGAKDHGGSGGRGHKRNQWNIGPDDGSGTIRAKLVGTVYDFDIEDAEEEEDLENLRAMRERRKSSDIARAMAEARLRDESPRSLRGQTPPLATTRDLSGGGGSMDEDDDDEIGVSEGSDTSFIPPPPPPLPPPQSLATPQTQPRLSQFPQPVLPGPVDMRTYSAPAVPAFEPPPPPPTPPSSASSSSTAIPHSVTPPPSSGSSYHNHLLGSYAGNQVPDLLEDFEKELIAAGVAGPPAPLSNPPSSSNPLSPLAPQQIVTPNLAALSPSGQKVPSCLSESRNQLKVKIKGPFLDANYTSTPVVPVVSAQVVQQTSAGVIHMPGTPGGAEHHHHHHHQSLGVSVTPSSNLRRMRKKELLRQYWTQDMNMDDGGAAGAVGGAAPMGVGPGGGPGGMASVAGSTAVTSSVLQPAAAVSRAVITIPKAVASMTSIPTREDYRAVVDMEKKRRKEKSGQGVPRELRNLDPSFVLSGEEGEREGRRRGSSDSAASRRRGRPPKGSPATAVAPKLKIKFGGTDIAVAGGVVTSSGAGGGSGSGDERRFRGRPPKKRLSAVAANAAISSAAASAAIHVPTVEELKRESMKYRRMIMADFDEEEKKKPASGGGVGGGGNGKKKHSRRGSDTSLSMEASSSSLGVEIVHSEQRESAPTKLIIRFNKRSSVLTPGAESTSSSGSRVVEPLVVPVAPPEGATGTVPERPSSRGGGAGGKDHVPQGGANPIPPLQPPSAVPSTGGIAPAAAPEVRTSKVVPIRLKLARCEEGYVMKAEGNSGSGSLGSSEGLGVSGDSGAENSLRVAVEKKGCEVR